MKKFWQWMVVMAECECTLYHWTVHSQMIKMVNFMLCTFSHNKKIKGTSVFLSPSKPPQDDQMAQNSLARAGSFHVCIRHAPSQVHNPTSFLADCRSYASPPECPAFSLPDPLTWWGVWGGGVCEMEGGELEVTHSNTGANQPTKKRSGDSNRSFQPHRSD